MIGALRRRLRRLTKRYVSYSQFGEDIYLVQNCLNALGPDGVVVEVGAYDGRTYSNTLLFENLFHARAVLIEPSPDQYRSILVNRPRASAYKAAIARSHGVVEFCSGSPVSGIASVLTEEYRRRWNTEAFPRVKVLTMPLSEVLEVENAEHVDLLSIDVQGAELQVLESMDWSVPVGIVCVEAEGHRPEDDDACRQLLAGKGFVRKQRLHLSEIWENPGYSRRGCIFDASRRYPFRRFDTPFLSSGFARELLGVVY